MRHRPTVRNTFALGACLLVTFGSLAGCGGPTRDADAPTGTWKVEVTKFKFRELQQLGRHYRLKLNIKNIDDTTIPNLNVKIDGLNYKADQKEALNQTRPIWVIDEQSPNAATDTTNLYRYGPIKPGETGELYLDTTPIKSGRFTISYTIAADLYGNAKATLEDGTPATGQKEIAVDPTIDITQP